MGKRHRVIASRPPSAQSGDFLNVLFSDLIVRSKDDFVELESCIPFTKIRPLSSSGVRRLINSFSGGKEAAGECDEDTPYHITGLALGTDMPMVVPLNGSSVSYVKDHFRSLGLNDEDIEERVNSRSQWYGVVDGLHSHAALTYLKENNVAWRNFKWYVKILNQGYPAEKYRQLSRVQNSRHHPHFFVELTLFDVLYNLRLEHEKLKRENRKCGGSETANAYDGAQHAKNSTLQQKANVSIRLPMEVLEEMGKIMNKDHPDLVRSVKKKGTNPDDLQVMEREDCRFFKRFITISTLKGSSSFMNSKENNSHVLQINCLHRVKDLYSESRKTIKADDLTKQFKYSKMAYDEHNKFLRFIESDEWPAEMRAIKENLLRSVMLDKELEENNSNDHIILPKLLDSYRRHFPEIANMKEAKWKASIEEDIDKVAETESDDKAKQDEQEGETPPPPDQESLVGEGNAEPLNPNQVLEDKNIQTYNMSWKDYLVNETNADPKRFDLLLCRPPSAPSRSYIRSMRASKGDEEIEKDEMEAFCKFSKRILKSGAYIFLLIHFTMFREWYELLDSAGFDVMSEEFIIAYDTKTIKRRKLLHFTQSAHDIAIVARCPGTHPNDFKPDFLLNEAGDNALGDFIFERRLSIISNAPVMKTHLTRVGSKVPFDLKEFDDEIFRRIIEKFTPVNGSVIDPFCRTMTAGLACLKSHRSCHLIEKSKDCFEEAMIRLRKAASPLPSHEAILHDTYTEPMPLSAQVQHQHTVNSFNSSQNDTSTQQETEPSLVNRSLNDRSLHNETNLNSLNNSQEETSTVKGPNSFDSETTKETDITSNTILTDTSGETTSKL